MGNLLVIKNADFSRVSVEKVTPIVGVRIYTSVSPASGGTISGAGVYQEGDTVTLTATANAGYTFVRWSDGITTSTRTITVGISSMSYAAIFEFNDGMVAQDGWIDANGLKSKSNTGAFFGTIEVKSGDSVQFIKTSGTKGTWYAWLEKPLTIPTTDGQSMEFAYDGRIVITTEGIMAKTYDVTKTVPVDCYLAVSLFANDGNEDQTGRHAPTTIKINGNSILIPTSL